MRKLHNFVHHTGIWAWSSLSWETFWQFGHWDLWTRRQPLHYSRKDEWAHTLPGVYLLACCELLLGLRLSGPHSPQLFVHAVCMDGDPLSLVPGPRHHFGSLKWGCGPPSARAQTDAAVVNTKPQRDRETRPSYTNLGQYLLLCSRLLWEWDMQIYTFYSFLPTLFAWAVLHPPWS